MAHEMAVKPTRSIVISLVGAGVLFHTRWEQARAQFQAYADGLTRAHIPLARKLAGIRHAGDSGPVFAIGDAGAVPFLSGWRTLDTFGLNYWLWVMAEPNLTAMLAR